MHANAKQCTRLALWSNLYFFPVDYYPIYQIYKYNDIKIKKGVLKQVLVCQQMNRSNNTCFYLQICCFLQRCSFYVFSDNWFLSLKVYMTRIVSFFLYLLLFSFYIFTVKKYNKVFLNDLFTNIFVRRLDSTFNLVTMCCDVILFAQLTQVTTSVVARILKFYLFYFTPELFKKCPVPPFWYVLCSLQTKQRHAWPIIIYYYYYSLLLILLLFIIIIIIIYYYVLFIIMFYYVLLCIIIYYYLLLFIIIYYLLLLFIIIYYYLILFIIILSYIHVCTLITRFLYSLFLFCSIIR